MRVESVLDLVGRTPVVQVRRACDDRMATLWAKLEFQNPGGSIKDRIAVSMLDAAEQQGEIRPGRTTVVEATSGNTGIGLAMACAVRGYRLILTMPDDVSVERRLLLSAYGAEVVLTPARLAMPGAIDKAHELGAQCGSCWFPRQFENPANPAAHREHTGPELVEAFDDVGLDGLVVGVGTGGTVSGVAPVLRARWPEIRIWAVEPAASPVLSGGSVGLHGIQGIGAGFVPPVLDRDAADRVVPVEDEHAYQGARMLARAEGLLVGTSSGACFVAARQLARELGPGRHVAFVCASNGERYLSTTLFR
ncbi:MAG: cysteine synthase A [Alphaproteobacteria bacterium]|nr:cysteine synthase A [Alphaproteobacteria bacterium]